MKTDIGGREKAGGTDSESHRWINKAGERPAWVKRLVDLIESILFDSALREPEEEASTPSAI